MKNLSVVLVLTLTLVWLVGCSPVSETETVGEKQGTNENNSVVEEVFDSNTSSSENKKPTEKDEETTQPATSDTVSSYAEPTKEQSTTSATVSSVKSSSTAAQTTGRITREEAKRIALEQAGASEKQISRYTIELDYDDDANRWEYEISFHVGNIEYDIELAAKDGNVLRVDKEREDEPVQTSATTKTKAESSLISKTEAKSLALKRAGVDEKDISRYTIELDYDDDTHRWEYEISFNVDRMEYDITLDGTTGKVLEFEKDVD